MWRVGEGGVGEGGPVGDGWSLTFMPTADGIGRVSGLCWIPGLTSVAGAAGSCRLPDSGTLSRFEPTAAQRLLVAAAIEH